MEIIVTYHPLVITVDIPQLDTTAARRVRGAIEKKLMINPVMYGSPLHATLKPYWKLRVGDWRVVYEIKEKEVRILIIGHRREVYDLALKRIK